MLVNVANLRDQLRELVAKYVWGNLLHGHRLHGFILK